MRCWCRTGERESEPVRPQESRREPAVWTQAGNHLPTFRLTSPAPSPPAVPSSPARDPRSLGGSKGGSWSPGARTGAAGARTPGAPPQQERLRKPRQTPEPPRARADAHLISSWHLPPLPPWKSHRRGPLSGDEGPAPSTQRVRFHKPRPPTWPHPAPLASQTVGCTRCGPGGEGRLVGARRAGERHSTCRGPGAAARWPAQGAQMVGGDSWSPPKAIIIAVVEPGPSH